MTSTADRTLIDDAVIDGLRPQARRYDVAVSDGLVLAVLPNGAKTWAWVYDGPGQPHRQTLGVYPEMSLDKARRALESAAQTRRSGDTSSTEYVIRDGRIQSSTRTIDWKWPLAGALVMLAAGVLIGWQLLGGRKAEPTAAVDSAPASDPAVETLRVAATATPPVDMTVAVPAPDVEADTPADVAPDSDPQADTPSAAATVTAPILLTPATTIQPPPADVPPAADPQADTPLAAAAAVTAPILLTPATTIEPPPADVAPAADPRADTPLAPAQEPADTVIGALVAIEDFEPGVTDARVARAQITTAVIGREPVDALGPVLIGNGEDIQTYYFFTELRSLAGQRVRHRWIAGNRIEGEVPFEVGGAWRWRVFSSKRLLASMAGPWRVQVVTDDDVVIHDYAFEFQP